MKLSWQKKLEGLFPWGLSWPISFSSQAPLCFLSQAKVPFIHFFLFLSHEALYWWQCWSSPTFYILSGTLLSNRIFILFFGCKRRNHFVLSSPTIKTNEDEVRLLRRSRRREERQPFFVYLLISIRWWESELCLSLEAMKWHSTLAIEE